MKTMHKDVSVVRELKRMVTLYADQLATQADSVLQRMLDPEGPLHDVPWRAWSDEALLAQRNRLVAYIRKGMLERKNMELEITVLAAVIWMNRQRQSGQQGAGSDLW